MSGARHAPEEPTAPSPRDQPFGETSGVRVSTEHESAVFTGRAVIGRAPGCDVRVDDRMVSAFHVEVAADAWGLSIKDLGSTNGTFYGGALVRDGVVPSGATIQLGSTLVRLDLEAVAGRDDADLQRFGALSGSSRAMREALTALSRLARTELSVLIQGETGTGKELAARAIHDASMRAAGEFVVLDCTSVPSGLAESVLFGHEKGAFTGATEARPGLFEAAQGGTIFLDEIGELRADLQPRLLRVLERREVMRVGSNRARPVNVRVLSATWRDLRSMVNDGSFREDLYQRAVHARVVLPPLRDRRDDIAGLVQGFLDRLDPAAGGARAITREALDELTRRPYPGNVRELRSTVERAAMLAVGAVITPADLAFERIAAGETSRAVTEHVRAGPRSDEEPMLPFKAAKQSLVADFERQYLARLLARADDNLSHAAAVAGIDRNHLRELCRRHGLRSTE